jgi:hypothetical protein
MVRTLLKTTMCWVLSSRQPARCAPFSIHQGRITKLRRSVGNRKCTEVHRCPSSVFFALSGFRSHESEIGFGLVLHWTNPADIPRISASYPRRGWSQGRLRRREAVKTLDTALSASAHDPNYPGNVSVSPRREPRIRSRWALMENPELRSGCRPALVRRH